MVRGVVAIAVWSVDARAADADAMRNARMAADPYDFMRGTARVFLAGLGPSPLVHSARESGVRLFGDPHPENLGTTARPEGDGVAQSIEFVNMDGTGFGAWTTDVRRAALGLAVLVDPTRCDCRAEVVTAMASAYASTLRDLAAGRPSPPPSGRIVDALLAEARSEGLADKRLLKRTTGVDLSRRFVTDERLDHGVGLLTATAAQRVGADGLLNGWTSAPSGFRLLDVAARSGIGVASLPAERLLVAFNRGAPGACDDDLLELREVLDAPVGDARGLWSVPDADPLAAVVVDGDATFRIRSASSWFQGLDHEDVLDGWNAGAITVGDLADLGTTVGHLLAMGHARAPGIDGETSLGAIVASLDERALIEVSVHDAGSDLTALLVDYNRFIDKN